MKRLFVDMDGVLAKFKEVKTLEKLYEKSYFLNLEPQKKVIEGVEALAGQENVDIYILSSVLPDSPYALDEKNEWLDNYLPFIDKDHRLFPAVGEDKGKSVPGGVKEGDYLLDDYTKNLIAWPEQGEAIKLLNGINHTRGTWQGQCIDIKADVIKSLLETLQLKESENEKKVTSRHNGKKLLFSDEQIKQASEIDLVGYLEKNNYKLKQKGTDFKVEKISGGLYVNPEKNSWFHFGENEGGGIIQFVMKFEGLSWKESIKRLLKESPISTETRWNKNEKEKEKEVKELVLPLKNKDYRRLFAYLIKTRKIDKQVVEKHIKENTIYQSQKGSVIFLGRDTKGEVCYAHNKSTSTITPFAFDEKGSDKRYGFKIKKGEGNKLYVFESAVDLMSYQSLLLEYKITQEDAAFLSLGGVSDKALVQYLSDHQEVENIIVCTDNDEAGEKAFERIKERFSDVYEIKRQKPRGKDFNEDLKAVNALKEKEFKKQVIKEQQKSAVLEA